MSFLFAKSGNSSSASSGTASSALGDQPRRMTDPEGMVSRRAQRLERSKIAKRSGRSSTNLTRRQPGTQNFTNSALGSV